MTVLYSELKQPLELDFANPLTPNKIAILPGVGQEGYATNFVDNVNKSHSIYDAITDVGTPYFAQINTEATGNVADVSGPIENGLFTLRISPRYHTTAHDVFKSIDYANNHRFYIKLGNDSISYRFGDKAQTAFQLFSKPTDTSNILSISVRWIKNGGTYEYECIVYDTDFIVLSTFNATSNSPPFTSIPSKNTFYKLSKLYGLQLSEGVYSATDALNVVTNLYGVFQPYILEKPAIVISSVIGEQIEQGELSQVIKNHSLFNVVAEQCEEAVPVALVSKASIASINAEQIEQGQTNQVAAKFSLPSLDAEQCEEAVPVALVSKVSISGINAEQIEQGQANQITVNYSLFGASAEQHEQAAPVTLTSNVAIANISAEQIEQASTVNLGGANLIVSLQGEQLEQGEISPIMANHSLLSLSAEQLEQVAPVTLTSNSSINSVIAEQIEQGALVEQQIILAQSLLKSNQVNLIKTTFHYELMKNSSTLTLIKTTPTYSIQKV